jgi:cytochrome c oxidase subunit 3
MLTTREMPMAAEGSPATVASHFADAERQETAANLGMWIFLTTEVLFFGVLFAGYTVTRVLHADAFALAGRHTDVLLGSINTAVLLTSSLTMALAVRAGSIGWRRRCVAWLAVTLVLGTVFLGIKGYEWHLEWLEGLVPGLHFDYAGPDVPGVQLFFFLYFVMTGAHAVHLGIGILVVAAIAVLAARGRFSAGYHTPVVLSGLYWHFIDVVWIFLYPLFYLVARS